MDLGLTTMIIIAFLAVIIVWYLSYRTTHIADDVEIILDDTEDKLVTAWYEAHINHDSEITMTETELATAILDQFYNIKVKPHLLIIGTNLNHQYYQHTEEHLPKKYLYSLREKFAINAEIAVIGNKKVMAQLRKNNKYDYDVLCRLYQGNLLVTAEQYLTSVLQHRWDKLESLNIFPHGDNSFFYSKDILPNIHGHRLDNGLYRYNLLCSNVEFQAIIARLEKSKETILDGGNYNGYYHL